MSESNNQKAESPKTAILVVHGVAARTNAPFDNLDRVTEMLSSAPSSSYPYYEKTILRPKIDEFLVRGLGKELVGSDSATQLMKRTLENFKAKETSFKTARNELLRRPSPRKTEEKSDVMVHLYECFWADISRGGSYGFLRKLIEFYQFALDLCSLGRKTLQYAKESEKGGNRLWFTLEQLYLLIEFIVSGIIPAANILLLCLLLFSPLVCQRSVRDANFVQWFFPIFTGLSSLCLAYFTISINDLRKALTVGFATGGLIFWLLHTPTQDPSRTLRLATGIGLFLLLSGITWYAYCTRKIRWRLSLSIGVLSIGAIILMIGALAINRIPTNPNPEIVIGLLAEYMMVIAVLAAGLM